MKVNMSLAKQFKSLIFSHLYMAFLTAAFGLGAFWWFITQDKWQQTFSVICMFAYFCVLYSNSHKIALHDKKGYANQKSYPLKGIVLSLGIVGITFISWALYKITWSYMSINGSISGYTGIFYNGLFILWTFPYTGFMGIFKGGMFWYSNILIYGFPMLAIGIGYFAGYNSFSIYEKFLPMMYEKKKD